MALAPEFDFDALIKQMAGGNAPAPAAPAVAPITPAAPTRAEKFGARLARGIKSPFLKFLPGLGILAETATGGDTVPNAIRTGVGIGALVNPAVGGPLATGMLAGEGIASGLDLAFQPGKSNILSPEFSKTVEAAGGTSAYVKGLGAKNAAPAPTVLAPDAAFSPADQKPGFVGGYQEVPTKSAGYGANSQSYQPVTRTVNPDGTVSITGTGSPRFSSGTFSGFGAAPGSTFQPGALPGQSGGSVGSIAGNFMGALIGMKQVSGDNARQAALMKTALEGAKVQSQIGLQSAQAQEALTKGGIENAHATIARMLLTETDPKRRTQLMETAASLKGRLGESERFTVPVGLGGMKPTDPSTVLGTRSGTLTVTTPQQPITIAQAIASAKKNKTFKSEEQVRADIAKLPGFRLTD